MLRNNCTKRFLISVFFTASVFLFSTNVVQAQRRNLRSTESLTIKNGLAVPQIFIIDVKKSQTISLEVKQNGMDVKVELSNSQGITVSAADYPLSAQETERIFAVADEDGQYQLKIDPKFPDVGGSATVKFDEIRKSTPDDVKRAEAEKLFSQAQSLRATGNTIDRRKAVEVYEKSFLIRQEIGDEIGELRTLTILSYLNRALENYEKSLEIAERILQFPNIAVYNSYRAYAIYQIGQIHFEKGEIEPAIASFKEALSLFAAPSPNQANILSNLGFAYQSIDEFDLAQKTFDEASANIRQFPDIYNEAYAQNLIGLFNFNSNEYDSAIENFKAAVALREKFGNRRGQAISLNFLGMTYQSLRMFDESLKAFQTALPISEELGDRVNQMDTLINMAYVLRQKGDSSKALELYEQALSIFGDKNSLHLSSFYLNRGAAYRNLSRLAEARDDFEKARLFYRRAGDIGGEAATLYNFAVLESLENHLDEAKAKIELALRIHEYEQAKYKNIRRLSGFLEQRRRYFDFYIDVLMRLDEARPNEGYALKALQSSESARMRTFIWQYREAVKNSPQSVDFQLISQIQNIQRQIGEQLSLLARAQSGANQAENVPAIEKAIASLTNQDESFKAQLRSSNPNVANLASPPTLSLSEMQAELDDETALVEYSLGEQRSYLWIIGKKSFQSYVLPKRAEIEAQAKNFYESLNQSEDFAGNRPLDKKSKFAKSKSAVKKDASEESKNLSRLLLIEKLAELPAKRLVLVADGGLNLIPFASLTYYDAIQNKNSFLSEKFDAVQLPSLTTIHILRQTGIKPFAPQSLAIIADPVFSLTDERLSKINRLKNKPDSVSTELSATLRDFSLTTLSRLPFTRTEAEKIAQNSPNNTVLSFDFKASRERLLNGEFDRFDVLHFATHGFLNSRHPELSGLVLSLVDERGNPQNGFLRTQDLYLLKIRPQMVVLSACQTGLGKQVENEGLIGLTRGFLVNGTPRVVATLWKVDDAATAELMNRFYRALLKENQLPSTALRTAQNELRQIPRFSHPRYWAAFVLTGEWR